MTGSPSLYGIHSPCVSLTFGRTLFIFEDVYHKTWKAQVLCDWQENPTAPGRGVGGGSWAHSCLAWVGPLPSHTRSFCQLPVFREDSAVRTLHCFCNYGRFQSTFDYDGSAADVLHQGPLRKGCVLTFVSWSPCRRVLVTLCRLLELRLCV